MTQLLPDDRPLYTRYRELGPLADALLSLEPEELLFFRVSADGVVDPHGEPAVLVVKDTHLSFLERPAALYERVLEPGSTRIYWFTPAELERPSTAAFVLSVRKVGETIVAPPPDEGSGGQCGACGVGA